MRKKQDGKETLVGERLELLSVLQKKAIADQLALDVWARTLKKAHRFGLDPERTQEAAQNAVMYMLEHFEDYRSHEKPEAYMEEVIHWRLMDMVLGRVESTARYELTDDDAILDQLAYKLQENKDADPAYQAALRELLAKLAATLSPRQKTIIKAVVMRGLTSEEIAQELGMRGIAVRQDLRRARTKMRRFLASHNEDKHGEE